jgi:hypothetical protein
MRPLMAPIPLKLDGLLKLTDETGIFQHTKYSTTDLKEGYTTDDNARALIAALKYHRIYGSQEALNLANTYLSFLLYMQKKDGRFHNFLGYDRKYRDDVGSEDSIGHALWACGYTVNTNAPGDMKSVAKVIFDRGLPSVNHFTSPRAMALAILGLSPYHQKYPNDQNVLNILKFGKYLVNLYEKESDDGWRWFEPHLTYANARLPQALFTAYEVDKDSTFLEIARDSLDFLLKVQIVNNIFIPIGSNGWYLKNGKRAIFDQQPIEASCMIEALTKAFVVTGSKKYRDTSQTVMEWYHGKNVKGIDIFKKETATCFDGITPEGVNQNQGAESTLSYYLAHLTLRENPHENGVQMH